MKLLMKTLMFSSLLMILMPMAFADSCEKLLVEFKRQIFKDAVKLDEHLKNQVSSQARNIGNFSKMVGPDNIVISQKDLYKGNYHQADKKVELYFNPHSEVLAYELTSGHKKSIWCRKEN